MERGGSLPCSQKRGTELHPEPRKSSPFYFLKISINPLTTEFLLNDMQTFSSYLKGNTLHLPYKDQPVNAV
jgi:hypothetical protein